MISYKGCSEIANLILRSFIIVKHVRIRPYFVAKMEIQFLCSFVSSTEHIFSTYLDFFICKSVNISNLTCLDTMERLAVRKTVKDSPCRFVHHRLSSSSLFDHIVRVANSVLSLKCRFRVNLVCHTRAVGFFNAIIEYD